MTTATVDLLAHDAATRATTSEMAAYLQALLGQKLTVLMAGAKDPKAVGRWARGREPAHETVTRLRHAYHVARLLREVESAETTSAWFVGMNPQLDDRAPALVLAEAPERVLQAARAFLVGG